MELTIIFTFKSDACSYANTANVVAFALDPAYFVSATFVVASAIIASFVTKTTAFTEESRFLGKVWCKAT